MPSRINFNSDIFWEFKFISISTLNKIKESELYVKEENLIDKLKDTEAPYDKLILIESIKKWIKINRIVTNAPVPATLSDEVKYKWEILDRISEVIEENSWNKVTVFIWGIYRSLDSFRNQDSETTLRVVYELLESWEYDVIDDKTDILAWFKVDDKKADLENIRDMDNSVFKKLKWDEIKEILVKIGEKVRDEETRANLFKRISKIKKDLNK